MPHLNREELRRYSRQLPIIGIEGQLQLKNAKILCVGAGGLGCPALQYLVASGVGTLGIMDADQVELSNLQRQILFTELDLGRNKALVISERLQTLNSQVSIDVYPFFLSETNADNIVANYDVILDASDNFPTRYLLNKVCRSQKKPLISASIHQFEAQLSVFNHNQGPCYQCLYPAPPPDSLAPNCSLSGVLGVLPGVAGCLQALEAIKIVLNRGAILSGTLLSMDLLTMQFKYYDIRKQNCSEHPAIKFKDENNRCSLSEISEMTAIELVNRISSDPESLQLLDVREPFEREICHIGGTHIPISLFTSELAINILPPDKLIVVYCKSGARSASICQQLQNAGFTQVCNLKGGLINWIQTVDSNLPCY